MNTNCFAASLRTGYGQPVASDMLEALGLLDEVESACEMPAPIRISAGVALLRTIRPAANGNLRRVG